MTTSKEKGKHPVVNIALEAILIEFLKKMYAGTGCTIEDVRELLQKAREVFDLDMVFISENREYFYKLEYTMVCCKEGVSPTHHDILHITEEDYQDFVSKCDEDSVYDGPDHYGEGARKEALLIFSFRTAHAFYGVLGFRSLQKREWSAAERDAIIRIGRAVMGFVMEKRRAAVDAGGENALLANSVEEVVGMSEHTVVACYINLITGNAHILKDSSNMRNHQQLETNSHKYDDVLAKYSTMLDASHARKLWTSFCIDGMRKNLLNEDRQSMEYSRAMENGEVRWFRLTAIVVRRDNNSQPEMVSWIIDDITELIKKREQSELALQIVKKRYFGVIAVDLAADQYTVLELDDDRWLPNIIGNKSFKDRLQWLSENIVHENFRSRFLETLDPEHLNKHFQESKHPQYIEYRCNIEGGEFWVRVEIIPSEGYGDSDQRVTIYFKDITAQIKGYQTNEILNNSLRNIYFSASSVDLDDDSYIEMNVVDDAWQYVENNVTASKVIAEMIDHVVDPDFRADLRRFIDFNTLAERIGTQRSISHEYKRIGGGWCRADVIPVEWHEDGTAKRVLCAVTDINELKRKEEDYKHQLAMERSMGQELEFRAEHDPMTGLMNRSGFKRLSQAMESSEAPVGFMLLDVDLFKEVNDSYGHETGDRILSKVAKLLQERFNSGDYVFRFGGDEFAVILGNYFNYRKKTAPELVEEINLILGDPDDGLPSTSVSAGVAYSEKGFTHELYKYADQALYKVKHNGRCGCHIHSKDEEVEDYDTNGMEETSYLNEIIYYAAGDGGRRLNGKEHVVDMVLGSNSAVGIITGVFDKQMSIYSISAFAVKNLGYTYTELMEKTEGSYLNLVYEPDKVVYSNAKRTGDKFIKRRIRLLNREGTPTWFNEVFTKIIGKDGSELWVVSLRPIDDIVKVRNVGQRKSAEIKVEESQTIRNAKVNAAVMDAMSSVYYCNYYISLETGAFFAYKEQDDAHRLIGTHGYAEKAFAAYVDQLVALECQDQMRDFLNIHTLRDRLKNKKAISCEYLSNSFRGWCRASFIPVRYNEKTGALADVVFLVASIDEFKKLELDQKRAETFQRKIYELIYGCNFSFVGIINAKSRMIKIMESRETIKRFERGAELPYNLIVGREQEKFVAGEDKERFKQLSNFEYVMNQLDKEGKLEFRINQYKQSGERGLFAYNICYFNREEGLILVAVDDITERSERDVVTGHLNEEGFIRKAEYYLNRVTAIKNYAIIHFDVKGFKAVNELIGFENGNIILREIAKKLAKCGLNPLVVGRSMADHFYILVDQRRLNYDILTRLCDMHINGAGLSNKIHLDCGVYLVDDISLPVRAMCDKARLAKQYVDQAYGVPYFVFDENLRDTYLERRRILEGLDQALDNGEFKVYYQPIFDAKTKKIASAEALVRWSHPERGIISPALFIPTLEERGHISRLDLFVAHSVQSYLKQSNGESKFIVPVSVNLSRMDFYNDNMLQSLMDSMTDFGLEHHYMRFEVTESSYAEIPEAGERLLVTLRNMGSDILVDDFGSGYSSLGSLANQQFDIIKLDMTFVRSIGKNSKSEAIVKTCIDMAHLMGAKVVAEGVETVEHFNFLQQNNCDYIQGYYFSKPLSEDEFTKLLDQQ